MVQRGGNNSGAALARARLYVALKFCVVTCYFHVDICHCSELPRTAIIGSGVKTRPRNKKFSSLSFLTWKIGGGRPWLSAELYSVIVATASPE